MNIMVKQTNKKKLLHSDQLSNQEMIDVCEVEFDDEMKNY